MPKVPVGELGGSEFPEFFIATLCVLVLSVQLHWLPAVAYMSGDETFFQLMRALLLPIVVLVIVVSAQMVRMTRAGILNVLHSPYIEMAILKGVPRRRIILRHALFNAIGPIVNVISLILTADIASILSNPRLRQPK